MPSAIALPTIADLRTAFQSGVLAKDRLADLHDGSIYDIWGGVGAMLFERVASRDRDVFRSTYFDFAEGGALDRVVEKRFGAKRVLRTAGQGTAEFARATTTAGAGSFFVGTRISVIGQGPGRARSFRITGQRDVGATATFARVNVETEEEGASGAFDSRTSPYGIMRFEDSVWDPSWRVTSLICSSGTDREKDQEVRARVRQERIDARTGYAKAITDACVASGAVNVSLFLSDLLSTNPSTGIESIGGLDANGYGDVGLNWCFVGDSAYQSRPELLAHCRFAVDSAAVCGTDLQIAAMAKTPVRVGVALNLWKDPGSLGRTAIAKETRHAIARYFETRENAFYFRKQSISGTVLNAAKDVQEMVVTTSPAEPVLVASNGLPFFATSPLPRYFVNESEIAVTIDGPKRPTD